MNKTVSRILLAAVLLSLQGLVSAQDIFNSRGTTAKSYDYLEVGYIRGRDKGSFGAFHSDSLAVEVYFSVRENIALIGGYIYGNARITEGVVNQKIENDLYYAGLAYYREFGYFQNTDIVTSFTFGQERVLVTATGFDDLLVKYDVQNWYLGLKKSFGSTIEIEGGFGVVRSSSDEFPTRTEGTLTARGIYRLTPKLDAGIFLFDINNLIDVGLGLRYTW